MLSKFSKGLIFDTRPKLLAQTSRGKGWINGENWWLWSTSGWIGGGGCEGQMYYSQWKYVNGNVPRIRDLHESLARLIDGIIIQSFLIDFLIILKNHCSHSIKSNLWLISNIFSIYWEFALLHQPIGKQWMAPIHWGYSHRKCNGGPIDPLHERRYWRYEKNTPCHNTTQFVYCKNAQHLLFNWVDSWLWAPSFLIYLSFNTFIFFLMWGEIYNRYF
jgi:hypothetical protein